MPGLVWRAAGAAGRGWEKQGALGPGLCRHTRLFDNRPPFPNPSGTAQPCDAARAEPGDPHRAKSLLFRLRELGEPGGTPWHPLGQGTGRAGSAAPQHRRQLRAGCPSAVIRSSDIRAATQPLSPSAQTPKQLRQLPSLVVFPCNVSPGSLPMTSLLHIPSPGRAEGTAGTPRISRAHYTQFNRCEGCGRLAWIRGAC